MEDENRCLKLLGIERSSYRYEPRPDRDMDLREALVKLARQKPRYGYRRLYALLERRGIVGNRQRRRLCPFSVQFAQNNSNRKTKSVSRLLIKHQLSTLGEF